MTLKEVLAQEKENLLCSLRECVRIRSVREEAEEGAPYGRGVRACLDYTLSLAKSLGLRCGELGHQVGWCEYGEGNEMVAVLGHLDVVPEGDGWTVDPYEGVIRDGKIYGRGTMDDKGPTIASIYALSAIQRLGLPVRRRIRVLFGTNEETGSADMKYYRANGGEIPVAGFTPDGEYPLVNGEKGIVNVSFERDCVQRGALRIRKISGGTAPNVVPDTAFAELSCDAETAEAVLTLKEKQVRLTKTEYGVRMDAVGVSAHGSTPWQGENAVGRLLLALHRLPFEGETGELIAFLAERIGMECRGESLGVHLHDDISGDLSLNLGVLQADETRWKLVINFRYPVTKRYSDCGPKLKQQFEAAGFMLTDEVHKECLYVPAESEMVKTLLAVYGEKTGLPAKPICIGGGTYAKMLPNIVAFGPIFPGDEVREHKPDEYMEIDRLMENADIFAEAMYRLAK